MKAHVGPLGKLDHLPSKKTCFQQKNGRVQTGLRGGPILSLLTISTLDLIIGKTVAVTQVEMKSFFSLLSTEVLSWSWATLAKK